MYLTITIPEPPVPPPEAPPPPPVLASPFWSEGKGPLLFLPIPPPPAPADPVVPEQEPAAPPPAKYLVLETGPGVP